MLSRGLQESLPDSHIHAAPKMKIKIPYLPTFFFHLLIFILFRMFNHFGGCYISKNQLMWGAAESNRSLTSFPNLIKQKRSK